MERWHTSWLGLRRFPSELTAFDLDQFFTFDPSDQRRIESRRRAVHRLSVGLQIGFIRMTGCTLDAVQIVPANVIRHVAAQLHLAAPDIASLRALYNRQRTLHDHQQLARDATGFRELSSAAQRVLKGQLRREAATLYTVEPVIEFAQRWLYEQRYLMPGRRRLYNLARGAIRHGEQELLDEIVTQDESQRRDRWISRLGASGPRPEMSVLEWLQLPPRRHHKRRLGEMLAKRELLVELGAADLTLPSVSAARRYYYAKRILRRRPSMLKRIHEPLRTIEIACFIRHQLLQITDTILELALHRMNDIRRHARDQAVAVANKRLSSYQQLVCDLTSLCEVLDLSGDELRTGLRRLLSPYADSPAPSHTAEIRQALSESWSQLRPFLRAISQLPLDIDAGHPLSTAMPLLRELYQEKHTDLPVETSNPFGPCWHALVEREDRREALAGYEAATLVTLQRSLKNGSAHTEDSNAFRDPDALFIPENKWKKARARHYWALGLPRSARAWLKPVRAALNSGLAQLDEALGQQALTIDDGRVRLAMPARSSRPSGMLALRRRLIAGIGQTQLPDVLLEVDSATRFSWQLLGRPPRHERELVTVYAALLALGSDLSAADVVRMIPVLSAEIVEPVIGRLEHNQVLRTANDTVVEYMRGPRITRLWGPGVSVSADMMSLEATRHLWLSRLDPRRRSFAVGTYTHVLDQWGIVYD